MSEYSKTVRFDFPGIPIIGTLYLLIVLANYLAVFEFLIDNDGKLDIGMVSVSIVALGTAGIFASQIVALAFFDVLFPMKRLLIERVGGSRSSYEWFTQVQSQAMPLERSVARPGNHRVGSRDGIDKLSKRQMHATLHALEMECRELSPPFGVQMEYYYSLYLFFFTSAILCSIIVGLNYLSFWIGDHYLISSKALVLDGVIIFCGILGSVRARRIKEYLRVTLFNHDRVFVLNLLSKWFHCQFYEMNSELLVDDRAMEVEPKGAVRDEKKSSDVHA